MKPIKVRKVLNIEDYENLLINLPDLSDALHDSARSRHMKCNDYITKLGKELEPLAKEIFKSNTLKSTYSLYCKYFGNASMEMHKDDNACTYTIDLCVKQDEPWALWVEDLPYVLEENEALCYLGNDQMHGRKPKNLGERNTVEMIFFHYAEPDHWWFVKNK